MVDKCTLMSVSIICSQKMPFGVTLGVQIANQVLIYQILAQNQAFYTGQYGLDLQGRVAVGEIWSYPKKL